MIKATKDFLEKNDALFEQRKQEILNTKDLLKISGTTYYVSNNGDDNNDGKSPETAWKTIERINNAELSYGDGVFFNRGDIFRGCVMAVSGVSYGAYGEGPKPKIYSSDKCLADEALWELYDKEHNIWKLKEITCDVGTLVFNHGEAHSRKLIPSFKNNKFVCRNNPEKLFVMSEEMTEDLDIYWHYTDEISDDEEHIILFKGESIGELYVRCDKGNPGKVFDSVEPLLRTFGFKVAAESDVTIDNICIKYVGGHGIVGGGAEVKNLTVTNCEFGWIGGTIQNFNQRAANLDRRGVITRFGNAIEIYGGCNKFTVYNNYIYEVYDAGITQQVGSPNKIMQEGIAYCNNVIEKCVYGIEYFLGQRGEEKGCIKDAVISDNFIRLSGYGWGQQRYNPDTPALINSWLISNPSENFVIKDNIFDRGKYNFLVLAAFTDEDCPKLDGNTYIQHLGGPLGRYGGYYGDKLTRHIFDLNAEETINNVFGDKNAKVYYIE